MTTDPYERGLAKIREVYAGAVRVPPEGESAFFDVMLRTIFGEVWDRDVLSVRDRRLLLMGAIAANGGTTIWRLQAHAALTNGELTPDELRETLIMLAPYAGYPNVAPLVAVCEQLIAELAADVAAPDTKADG